MIAQFALRLICGLSLIWCLSRREEITSGFFRIQMLITLGLSVLAGLTAGQAADDALPTAAAVRGTVLGTAIALGILSFLGSVTWTLERRRQGTLFAILIASASSLSLVAIELAAPYGTVLEFLHATGDALSAAGIVGAVTAAMLLGHWYLTATGMPLSPLVQFSRLFCLAVVIRAAFALWSMGVQAEPGPAGGLLLVLRWAGLAGPFLLAILTMRILRYRNTQSATGVLYAATILVFMGETAAILLSRTGAEGAGI